MIATPNEQWHQAQEIIQRALELEADERSDYLAAQVGDDPALRTEVLSLIEANDHVHRFLETPALRAWMQWCQDADAARIDRKLGPYRVLRRIGRASCRERV